MDRPSDVESLAARLEAHPDCRVLRRLDVTRTGEALTGPAVRLWVTGSPEGGD